MKEAQAAKYQQQADSREKAETERLATQEAEREAAAAAKAARDAAYAAYIDNVEFRTPGGAVQQPTNVLTREGIRAAQRTASPAILAEEALVDAMGASGELPSLEASQQLERLIAEARAAGVSSMSPQLKKAVSLMSVLQASAREAGAPDPDPMAAQMKAIFSDEFGSMPDLEDLD